jgi:hypothetical protein
MKGKGKKQMTGGPASHASTSPPPPIPSAARESNDVDRAAAAACVGIGSERWTRRFHARCPARPRGSIRAQGRELGMPRRQPHDRVGRGERRLLRLPGWK